MNIQAYNNCQLCPRKCLIDRRSEVGFCAQNAEIKVARASLHFWEEPCISGESGSGTVFFCGCTLGCVYCQNSEISRRGSTAGKVVTIERLSEIFIELQDKGANNINLVTPTMFSPSIKLSIELSKLNGLTLPILYNTSGYERKEVIASLNGSIDIYMPDFKYLSPEIASKYSAASNYPEYAKESVSEMVRQVGDAVFDENGMMQKGVIVRHLILPGQLRESIKVVDYLFSEYGNSIYYSLMSQYTPLSTLDSAKYPELDRKVTTWEYHKLIDHAISLGITNAFIQDGAAAKESFVPSFKNEGV